MDYYIGSSSFDFRFKNKASRRVGVKFLIPLIENMVRYINMGVTNRADIIESRGVYDYSMIDGDKFIKYDTTNTILYNEDN